MKKSGRGTEYLFGNEDDVDKMLLDSYDWSKHHTREVLGMLRTNMGQNNSTFKQVLKRVLSEREHIPTKGQAKKIRQELAKAQKNR